jgi:hypothetical protein
MQSNAQSRSHGGKAANKFAHSAHVNVARELGVASHTVYKVSQHSNFPCEACQPKRNNLISRE